MGTPGCFCPKCVPEGTFAVPGGVCEDCLRWRPELQPVVKGTTRYWYCLDCLPAHRNKVLL